MGSSVRVPGTGAVCANVPGTNANRNPMTTSLLDEGDLLRGDGGRLDAQGLDVRRAGVVVG